MNEGVEQSAGIRSIQIHEDYDYFYLTSDICILKLANTLVFREGEGAVSGVILPDPDDSFEIGSLAVVSGWGKNGNDTTSDVLMAVELKISSDKGNFLALTNFKTYIKIKIFLSLK
jgi:hypothetical protein